MRQLELFTGRPSDMINCLGTLDRKQCRLMYIEATPANHRPLGKHQVQERWKNK
jgi:hypothetical protein